MRASILDLRECRTQLVAKRDALGRVFGRKLNRGPNMNIVVYRKGKRRNRSHDVFDRITRCEEQNLGPQEAVTDDTRDTADDPVPDSADD